MASQALMIGLIAGIGILDGRIFGQLMFERPLVTGLLVGLVLGDLPKGIIIGAQLELIWMGIAGIGAATPPDVVTGGVLGTAFAIISGQGVEVALALAVPIAVLAQSLGVLVRIANTYFSHKADKYAREVNYKGLAVCMWMPVLLFFLSTFLPTFLAILLGADKVSGLINAIPNVVLEGLQIAGNILPAIGFALLIDMLYSRKMAPFFFIGFLAAAYGGLDITAIALFAACIALIIHFYIEPKKEVKEDASESNLTEGEIDFD
ncbi:PTS sugar transporter subunit IIC [Carnobacterium sp.]|uniref:PTS mannose/fructose/sorbose/N-acetylgalactosamine transporter subunit IIC n=1 Tax=Carnobacterium sp. TaxID=48221 RepID=UPI0028AD66EF|nr:PTS sugar transporter subunit IIC [Carnobacterium sp.]